MAASVVHIEIIGPDPARLREFYGRLFGWTFDTDSLVAPEVSDAGQYGFITPEPDAAAVAGGVGGGPAFRPHAVFYVGVPNVGAALADAQRLGATVVMPPAQNPNGRLVVAQFADPEGTTVGLAGPE